MKELRHGVKLKKVQTTVTHPVEYELTPYEILMDDVRYRRYTLNKVPVRVIKCYISKILISGSLNFQLFPCLLATITVIKYLYSVT